MTEYTNAHEPHDEQVEVWADEVADALLEWLNDFACYDDKLAFFAALKREIKCIAESAHAAGMERMKRDKIPGDDLIHSLEASGLWWMIGKGAAREGEPPYGCLLQQPVVDGSMVAKAEGGDLRECVERALADVPYDERVTDPHHGGKVSP